MKTKLDLSSKLGIICALLSAPYFFIFHFLASPVAGNGIVIVVISFLLPTLFYQINLHTLSKITLIVSATGTLFFYSLILGKSSGAYLVFISILSLPLILFKFQQIGMIVGLSLIPITAAYYLELINYQLFFTPIYLNPISTKIIHAFAMSTAFLFSLLSAYTFFVSHKKNEFKLKASNKKLEHTISKLKKANYQLEVRSKRDAEYKLARQFQERYLPELYSYKEITPSVIHEPSSRMVSGDFYDLRANGNNLGYFIVDVAGKGIESSYIAIQLHMILRTKITGKRTPKKIMEVINQEVKGLKALKKMCVGAYINVNLKEKKITYSRAGIDILWAIRENKIIDLDENSPPIGFGESNEFVEGEFKYNPEDIIISSTDGILDAKNEKGERYGESRLREVIRNHQVSGEKSLREAIYSDFKTYIGKEPLIDDLTVLILEIGDFRRF